MKKGMKSKKGGKMGGMSMKSHKSQKYWYAFDDDSWRVRKLEKTPEKTANRERDVQADYYGKDFYYSNDDVYYGPDPEPHPTGYYDTYDYYLNIPICPQPTPGPTFSPPPVFIPIVPKYVSFQIPCAVVKQLVLRLFSQPF